MKKFIVVIICIVNSHFGYSQSDLPRVGVSEFRTSGNEQYATIISAKVLKVLTDTRRFIVLDRTSQEAVLREQDTQKSEAFLDSKTTVKQDNLMGAEWIVDGNITKLMIFPNKTMDGTIQGYKASIMFTLQVQDVESGKTNLAETFSAVTEKWCASQQTAINAAVDMVEKDVLNYFNKEFTIRTKISKILTSKKDAATSVLIAGGTSFGLAEGDKLLVEKIELIDGKQYPSQIGELKITKIAGDDFSECAVTKGGEEILLNFNASVKLVCKLQNK